jgi:hypothetical protein
MNRCLRCGLTKAQLLSHWRQTNGGSNPWNCGKLWIEAGYRFNRRTDDTNPVKGCMSNEEIGLTGDPYYYYNASHDHARRSAGYQVPFFTSSVRDEWIKEGKNL